MGFLKNTIQAISKSLGYYSSNDLHVYQNNRLDFDANGRLVFWPVGFDRYQFNDRNFDEFVHRGYGENPYIFMIVDRIATLLKNIPVLLVDDEDNIIEDQRWADLKAKTNERDNWEEYIYRLASTYLVSGNGFTWGTSPIGMNDYTQLNVALPQNTVIQTDSGEQWGIPQSYSITNQYGSGVIDAGRMLHMIKPNIINDSNYGISALYSGQPIYTASNETFNAKASVHKNRGATGYASPKNSDDSLSETEAEQLQRAMDRQTAGSDKFGRIKWATMPIEFTQIGMSPNDLKLLELNKEARRDACALYSVPSVLFGDTDNSKYSNVKEAKQSIYTDAVLPLGDDIYQQLTTFLIRENWGIDGYLILDKSAIKSLQKDKNEEHDRIRKDVQMGIITPEQANAMLYPELGFEPQNNNNNGN